MLFGFIEENKPPIEIPAQHLLVIDTKYMEKLLGIQLPVAFFKLQILLEKKLLVVGELDDQRAVESVLQPFGEVKRNQMAQMKSFTRGASSSVEIEFDSFLIVV